MNKPDHRLHAYRDDLADLRLRDQVQAERYVEGTIMQVKEPVADIRSAPSPKAGLDTQFLWGEKVRVFEDNEGWCWVQSERDGYVGYTWNRNLTDELYQATHQISVPRTCLYTRADVKAPVIGFAPIGCAVLAEFESETRGTRFLHLEEGEIIIANHAMKEATISNDYVSIAQKLIHTPYLWGGTSAFGIDCSGLVQLSLRMAGVNVLRDTDMQSETIGGEIDPGPDYENMQRGDLVFWKGHVAIMLDDKNVIHANGHTMMVSIEPLAEAIQRIAYLYAEPTKFRRPDAPIG